jgi:elongation factor 1-beta
MAVTFYDLTSAAGLKKLDDFLLSRSYISGYPFLFIWDFSVVYRLGFGTSGDYVHLFGQVKNKLSMPGLRISL